MKVNVLARFITVLSLLFSMHSMALPQLDPYRGVVVVDDEHSEELLREKALQQVLVKVSGNTDIVRLEESKALNEHIPSMLAQFGYQEEGSTRYYYALFDKRKINNALIAMQQPVWGATRPNTLIWLVNEKRRITSEHDIKSSQDSALSWGLKKAEMQRGIAVQFPLADLDDSIAINASDITGRFYDSASKASQRYDTDYYVLAKLKPLASGKWRLNWQLVHVASNSKVKPVVAQNSNNGSKSYVMSAMVSELADYYAKQFAIVENNGEKLTQSIQVDGINSLENLTQLNRLLASLNAIESFEVTRIDAEQINLLVTLKGSLASLNNALNAQTKLVQSSAFHYQWIH